MVALHTWTSEVRLLVWELLAQKVLLLLEVCDCNILSQGLHKYFKELSTFFKSMETHFNECFGDSL